MAVYNKTEVLAAVYWEFNSPGNEAAAEEKRWLSTISSLIIFLPSERLGSRRGHKTHGPVRPVVNVPVIAGYTNKVEFN